MYTIRLDDTLMFDPRVDELEIFDARAQFEVNKTNGLDFTVYPSHPLYARFKRFKSIVELYQNNVLLFRGRVLNDEAGLYNEKKIICEGELAYFNDTIIRPFEFQGTIEGFLSYIISQHNSQVENIKKFTLGNVTVTNSTNNIVRSSIDAQTSWEIINNRLIKLLGGYIVLRRANNINYIDYLADSNYMSLQKIELGKNLLDLTRRINGDEVITALIPYGAKIDEQSDERITIKSVNNNIDYIYDQEAVEKHGWIFGTETWDDVTIPSNLLTKARQTLAAGILLNSSIELTALDLSLMDISIDEFRIFEYVKVEVPTHLIDDNLLISKMSLDILSPENNKLTLGLDIQTFTERQIQTEKAISNIVTIKGPKGDKGDKGDRGSDGIAGKDGVGLADTTVSYALSTSGTTSPTGGWTANVPNLVKGQYLWTRTVWVYTDGTNETGYSVTYVSKDGNNGSDGIAGKDGVGIKTTAITYVGSASGVTKPTTGWTSTIPNVPAGQYLWTRTIWTYTDNSTETGYSVARMGANGEKGDQGAQGPQGLVGPKGADGQQFYTWLKYADTPTSGMSDDPTGKKYIGLAYNKTTATESTTYSDYTWSLVQGPQGDQGTQGPKGADGQTTYTWIKYATSAAGANMSDSPTGKTYIGLAYNKTTATESNLASDYTWALIQGAKGDQGIQGLQGPKGDQGIAGAKGQDGQTSYTHIAYADNASGGGFNQSPVNKAYIGIYVDFIATDSTDPSKYKWSLIKGADGTQGVQGPKGQDGQTPYFHTAWANNETGTSGFSTTDSVNKLYIGTYTDYVSADSTDPSKYSWTKIKGDKGDTGAQGPQGIQGPAGTNGTSQYVHIRYSANSNGSGMTTTPQSNTQYIGLANTTSATAPTVNTSYTWTKTKGETGAQGNQGIQGPAGTNGQTTYTWVKYADTNTGTGLSDNPDGKLYIGLAFNKTTATESNTANDYTWSLMPQNIEIGARNLLLRSTETVGYWIDLAGNVASNNGTSVSDYIAIAPLSDYMFTKTSSTISDPTVGGYFRFAWYTEDKTYIDRTANSKNEFKWTAPSNAYYIRISYPDDSQVKLEKGNVATDWTPAPEDIQSELDDKASNDYVTEVQTNTSTTIEQLETRIRTEVKETFTSKNELSEYKQDVATNLEQTKNQFNFNFTNIEQRVSKLDGDSRAEFNEIKKYIRFEDGKIFLGSSESVNELEINNDEILFKQSGVTVAYFSGQSFHINRGAIVESLQIGTHKFMMIDNNITAVQWVGG